MELKQVIYKHSSNEKFNFHIIQDRKDMIIDKTSIAHKLFPNDNDSFLIEFGGRQETGDLLLRMTSKDNVFIKDFVCDYSDVTEV